ncbi:MAG: Nitrate reductase delta subunit [bacterium ADurb.Bin429]|nr:MAG: Nitrate reductase delta subunit [bacterium ADurb.Bin429]
MTPVIAEETHICTALGALFAYPTEAYPEDILTCRDQMRRLYPAAARALETFWQQMRQMEHGAREELYTGTFDLAPVCVPYVSVYLFGAENYKRSELMARLNDEYARRGFAPGSELPDHLGVLLRFLPCLPSDEQRELLHFCLRAPVLTMIEHLTKTANPYRHLLRAVQQVLQAMAEGNSHA